MNQYDRVHRVILADGVTSFETAVYGLGRRWPDAWTSGADRLAPSAPLRSAADPWATGGGLAELRRQGHVQIYLTRWKIEETFCFLKQSYHLQDIRVLRYQRLKNLVVLVTAADYFAATFLGQKLKLRILCERLLIISLRFFGIPPFSFYALADAIHKVLSQTSPEPSAPPRKTRQLELLLAWEG